MALLQIAEPGQSPMPHEKKRAVGIDLGTTKSLVASVRGGRAQVLRDADGVAMLPSVVNYSEDSPVVGASALARAVAAPRDTLASIKRFMGRGSEEAREEALRSHYEIAESEPESLRRIFLIRKIDTRFKQCERLGQTFSPIGIKPLERTIHLLEGLAKLRFALGIDQISDRFGAREIELPGFEGSAGKLAGFGKTGASRHDGFQGQLSNHPAAMK